MNRNINIYNEKEIKNKLKNFKEGADYSVFREGEKEVFNFHNNFLRDVFGDDYTTIYEVAESWDSDNFNHDRAEAEYENDKSHITYRYEHRINKDKSGYREQSGTYRPKYRNEKHS